MEITRKHIDGLNTGIAFVMAVPDAKLGLIPMAILALTGPNPTYDDLREVAETMEGDWHAEMAKVNNAPRLRTRRAARLAAALTPETPVCDRCGELALSVSGEKVVRLADGSVCPHCGEGVFRAPPQPPRYVSWVTRAATLATDDREAIPGVLVPLTDEGLRERTANDLLVELDNEDVSVTHFAAYLLHGAPQLGLRSALDVMRFLRTMGEYAEQPPAARRALVLAAKAWWTGRAPAADIAPAAPAGDIDARRLRDALATLYSIRDDFVRLAANADLDASRIPFSGSAQTMAFQLVEYAGKQHMLGAVYRAALIDYPRHAGLHAATAGVAIPPGTRTLTGPQHKLLCDAIVASVTSHQALKSALMFTRMGLQAEAERPGSMPEVVFHVVQHLQAQGLIEAFVQQLGSMNAEFLRRIGR